MEETVFAVRVGQSKFGLGVFAGQRLRVDDAVGEITGEVIDDPDYGSDFCMDLGNQLSLEPADPFRFLNHSCQPNCEIVQWCSEEGDAEPGAQLWLHAVREVQSDEELTIDYGWPAEAAIPCDCGAQRCRGWIVNPSEIEQLSVSRRAHDQARSRHDPQLSPTVNA